MCSRLLHLIACIIATCVASTCLEEHPCPGLPEQLCCQEISWSLDAKTNEPGVYPASPVRLIPVDCPSSDNSDNNAVCGLVQVYMQRFREKKYIEKDSGIWSVICNPAGRNKKGIYEQLDAFTMDAATVACRQMGFEKAATKFDYNLKLCRGNDLTDVCRGTVGAKHTSQLAARDDTFQCGETHQYLIDLVATERSMLRETDFQVMVDNRWKMYRRMGSCQSTAFNDNFVPMGDRFEGRCDQSSNVAVKCVGITNAEQVRSSIANGTWTKWSNWSNCVDRTGNEVKCKDKSKHGEDPQWLLSTKTRHRQCGTGYNCIGDWIETVPCTKSDFKSRRIQPCPCEFTQSYLSSDDRQPGQHPQHKLITLIKSFESLHENAIMVANPIGCSPNLTYYIDYPSPKSRPTFKDISASTFSRSLYRNGDFKGPEKYCPRVDLTKLRNPDKNDDIYCDKLENTGDKYKKDVNNVKRFQSEAMWWKASSWHLSSRRKNLRNNILKGIVECSNGKDVFRYNYRKGSALNDVQCSQKDGKKGLCLAKCLDGSDETTYNDEWRITKYSIRMKVKRTTTRKRSASPNAGRVESRLERAERKRSSRKSRGVKLHKVGANCIFSMVPLDFIVNQARRDADFAALLPTCKIEADFVDDSSDYGSDSPNSSSSDESSDYYNDYKNYK